MRSWSAADHLVRREATRRALAELVALAVDLARVIVAEGFAAPAPEQLRELVDHCLAVGHRVRLAATSPLPG